MAGKIKILYVDDEVNNLNSFKAALRFDYQIFTATNTTEALDLLIKNPDIHIILCDQRMPGKTGVEFFQEIRTAYPKPVRMLITGFTDLEAIIDAINKGNVLRYIKKPWVTADIKSAIEEGYKFYMTNSLLAAKNEELQKAYDALNEFSYSVTHGLRDPLLSVIGIVEIANAMENVPEEIREILNIVSASMLQLDNFIEQTHDNHRVRKEPQTTEISFEHLVAEIAGIYSHNARNKNIRFTYDVKQQEHFRSDETLLKVILNNLLSNAFKYQREDAQERFVALSVEVTDGRALIVVRDNGKGMDPEQTTNIFDAFYKQPSREIGSGLGLFNAKDATEKLGGTIQVHSQLKEGSEFRVVIPNRE